MEIKIGYNFEKNKVLKNELKEINKVEKELLENIANDLQLDDVSIVTNSDDYTTMQFKSVDLIRIKYTDRAKWISIALSKEDKNNNKENPLFDAQKNKSQVFWKSNIDGELNIYYQFIKNRYDEMNNW